MQQFGKFRLVEHLASGGMADVWRAELPGAAGFVKEVALKLVRGEHREDDAFTRMFIQEARLASRLDHANVVHVFELGQVDGQYYIAMELVRGRSLRAVTDRCREAGLRFGVPRAVHVCAEVARGLAYAHRLEVDGHPAGLVHRDVSPQNILLSYEGEVKLADFGIARAANADEQTRAGTIKGKLAYMAPEQARGEPVDGRADVFALGVVLWELCAGRRLFARESDAATLAALLDSAPVSRPSEWNEAVPPELDAAILGALERDRERRTRSAEDLERALASLRLRLAAADPDEIDVRALLRRLWPDGGATARVAHEPTAVMGAPPVPHVAEPATPPERQQDPRDAPTRTLTKPRPFSARDQSRRSLLLLLVLGFAVALAIGILRWGDAETPDVSGVPTANEVSRSGAMTGESSADPGARSGPAAEPPTAAPSPGATERGGAAAPTPGPTAERAPSPAPAPAPPAAGPSPGKRSASTAAPNASSARERSTLVVDVLPWATVYVDGKRVGDTPLTLQVPPGAHQLRAVHPRLGSAHERIDLAPGERLRWSPQLAP